VILWASSEMLAVVCERREVGNGMTVQGGRRRIGPLLMLMGREWL
jgi:hypothetical protein